jgi:hypothetical protein
METLSLRTGLMPLLKGNMRTYDFNATGDRNGRINKADAEEALYKRRLRKSNEQIYLLKPELLLQLI